MPWLSKVVSLLMSYTFVKVLLGEAHSRNYRRQNDRTTFCCFRKMCQIPHSFLQHSAFRLCEDWAICIDEMTIRLFLRSMDPFHRWRRTSHPSPERTRFFKMMSRRVWWNVLVVLTLIKISLSVVGCSEARCDCASSLADKFASLVILVRWVDSCCTFKF